MLGNRLTRSHLRMEASDLTYNPIRNKLLHEKLPYVAQCNLQDSKNNLDWAPIPADFNFSNIDSYICLG